MPKFFAESDPQNIIYIINVAFFVPDQFTSLCIKLAPISNEHQCINTGTLLIISLQDPFCMIFSGFVLTNAPFTEFISLLYKNTLCSSNLFHISRMIFLSYDFAGPGCRRQFVNIARQQHYSRTVVAQAA